MNFLSYLYKYDSNEDCLMRGEFFYWTLYSSKAQFEHFQLPHFVLLARLSNGV